jgi:hypothetical protein
LREIVDNEVDELDLPRVVLHALIAAIEDSGGKLQRISINAKKFPQYELVESAQKSHVDKYLMPYVPKGCSLTFSYWQERNNAEQFHSRHLLCDRCGIQFDPGLDEGAPGNVTQLILMEDPRTEDFRRKFNVPSPVYDLYFRPIERIG